VAAYFCISFVSLCAHKTRESRPPKPRPAATTAQVGGRLSFWERNSAWLLAYTNDYFLVVRAFVRLFLGGVCSCTTTFRRTFMGRYCFHSSCIKLDRLLRAAQHVDCWEQHHRCLWHWSCLWVQPGALSFTYRVLSVLIKIKREHEQSLWCHNVAHFYA
jgi:hypothetical protein